MTLGRRGWIATLYVAGLTVGLLAAYHPTIASGFARMQADCGDTLLNHYILEHTWQCLTRADYVGTLWSPPFYYPTAGTLAYSENMFGVAPVYWLLRVALPPDLAFQVWMMAISGLTFLSTAIVLRSFGVRHVLALLGAYWFAFGLPRLVQIGHQQLLGHLFAPPALWCMWMYLRTPRVSYLAGLAAATFLQLLSSFYLGWFLGFGLAAFALAFCWHDRATPLRLVRHVREHWLGTAIVAAAFALLTVALLAPYLEANRGFRRQLFECLMLLPRWNAWLAPGGFGPWAETLWPFSQGLVSEQYLFLGFTFLAVTAAVSCGLWMRGGSLGPARRRLAAACLLAAAVLVVVSWRGSGNFTLWTLVCKTVPGSRAVRVGARIAGIVYLLAITGGLVALEGWLRRWRRPALAHITAAVLLTLGVAEQLTGQLPSFAKADFAAKVERIQAGLTPGVPAFIEIEPQNTPIGTIEHQLAAMWAGLRANAPVVNGYSGRYPNGYPDCLRPMTREELQRWLAYSGAGNVKIVSPAALRLAKTDDASWPSTPTKPAPAAAN